MIKPNYNYRANPQRAIHVVGEFDDGLLAKTLPIIVQLRAESNEPITAYIDSHGGDARCLDVLAGALLAKDANNKQCRLITCAVGDAASAGAMLLVMGDYAIAHPHSTVHFHGIRRSEAEVTMEGAGELAGQLASRNRQIAKRLSDRMISRLTHRFVRLRPEFDEMRKQSVRPAMTEMMCFVAALERRTSEVADKIIDRSASLLARASELSSVLFKAKVAEEQNALTQDVNVLRQVISYEVRQHRKNVGWRLNEDGLLGVMQDYLLLRDFYLGEHRRALKFITALYGPDFLNDADLAAYEKLQNESKEKALGFLGEKTASILEQFWYFTVSASRCFMEGENRLSATDAYWLGAIDEVVGTSYYGVRKLIEKEETPKPSEPPPTAP
ncbi:MAG: ATP-dependent Clp protease proteolytic subunit [Verrucomicrobiia bacterium]